MTKHKGKKTWKTRKGGTRTVQPSSGSPKPQSAPETGGKGGKS